MKIFHSTNPRGRGPGLTCVDRGTMDQ